MRLSSPKNTQFCCCFITFSFKCFQNFSCKKQIFLYSRASNCWISTKISSIRDSTAHSVQNSSGTASGTPQSVVSKTPQLTASGTLSPQYPGLYRSQCPRLHSPQHLGHTDQTIQDFTSGANKMIWRVRSLAAKLRPRVQFLRPNVVEEGSQFPQAVETPVTLYTYSLATEYPHIDTDTHMKKN